MNWMRTGVLATLAVAVSCGCASAARLGNYILHGSINLKPYTCMCPHDSAYWKDRVYVSGLATSGSGPNVWAVNVANPDSLSYVNSAGVGFKTYGIKAINDKLYAASWYEGLRIYDISTGRLVPMGSYDPYQGAYWALDVTNDLVFMTEGTETSRGMRVIDAGNPGNPSLLATFNNDEGMGGVAARGSYLYYTENYYPSTGHPEWAINRLVIYNISDPANPYVMTRWNSRHPIGEMLLRGDYLYITWGESGWIGTDGDGLPSAGEYGWPVVEGSESWAGASGGVLTVTDNSTAAGSRVRWQRNLYADPADGTTVFMRARCTAIDGDTSSIVNVQIEDGVHRERFRLMTDRIVAVDSNLTYWLDASQWHQYRITTRYDQFKLYVDENGAPVLAGTMGGSTTQNLITFGGGSDAGRQTVQFDYFRFNGQEDLPPGMNGGVEVFNISDPTNPFLVGRFGNVGGGGACMMGDYMFYGSGGNGFLTLDISDPANPRCVDQRECPNGYEGAVAGSGKYIYVTSLYIPDEWQGWLYAYEAFSSDPDKSPPSEWSNYTLADASWDTEYLGEALPSQSDPAWEVVPGTTEALASDGGLGTLRVNDDSTSAKCQWIRNWNATNTRGATVLVRARCASCSLNGAPVEYLNNIVIEDGKFQERFSILPDKIRACYGRVEYPLTGDQWHTYRITTQGTQFKVYLDEQDTPILAGSLSTTTSRARVWFGSGSTASTQDIYFDYVQLCSNGVFGPASRTNTQTPNLKITVSDIPENDSISGLDPSSARVYWSTDGGVTWGPSGWDCTYSGVALPTASSPAWTVAEGSESYGSIVSPDLLRVNDNSIVGGSKIKWSRSWGASPANGTTVLVKARCASASDDLTYVCNVFVEDGARREVLKILPDRIVTAESGQTYMLDGTQWHTYRMTTSGSTFRIYVDDNPAAVLTGTMGATTSENRVMFGSGGSSGKQDIYFDYVNYSTQGAFAPGQSGVAGQPISCTGQPGDYDATLTATAIQFNQWSETNNKVKFSVRDMAGNIGFSPVYNVRLDANAGPRVSNVTCDVPDGLYRASSVINVQVTFTEAVTVTGSPKLQLETGAVDRLATCTGGSGTNTLVFTYQVQTSDVSPDLDCVGVNALQLNGGTIKSVVTSATAFPALPLPGASGSLSYNKNVQIDAQPPIVHNVTSLKSDGVYKAGEQIDILVRFSEAVNVTGTPQLELETGTADRKVNYSSGSGTDALTFSYTVQPGDVSPDLDYKATGSLTGGTIRDAMLNNAVRTLPSPGTPGSLADNKTFVLITDDGSIAAAKQQALGSSITLGDKVLYLKQGAFGYIEESDRTCGIRIEGTFDAAADSLVCLRGVIQRTAGGELYLAADLVTPHGAGAVAPLGASNRSLAGGLMDGLYITAWGQVLGDPTETGFVLSDGADPVGITVITNGLPGVTAGQFVTITGAAGFDGTRVIYKK